MILREMLNPVCTVGRHSFCGLGRRYFDVVSCLAEFGILGVVDVVAVVAGGPAGNRSAWGVAVVAVDAEEEGGSCYHCS